jgi:transcriptional regulator with XRE-family HTH domain
VTVGNRILAARKRAGISQTRLAELVGIDSNTISRWERDIVKMKAEKMAIVAAALNTSVAYLLGEEEAKEMLNATAVNYRHQGKNNSINTPGVQNSALVQGINNNTVIINNDEHTLTGEAIELIRVFEALDIKRRTALLGRAYALEEEASQAKVADSPASLGR